MLGSLLSEATGFAPYPVMVSPQKRPLEDDTRTDAAGVGLRPRSQRRVVPEELMASQRRGGAGSSSGTTPGPLSARGDDDDEPDDPTEAGEKKTRFVWTPELHSRFETAVHKLGVAHAKPQAIRQLMGCDEEGAPTRQNIKSHLQKYRLLIQKRTGHHPISSAPPPPEPEAITGIFPGGIHPGIAAARDARMQHIEPMLQKQQKGLLMQLELQAKLQSQLMLQRSALRAV
mgnify:CR=1 FL=1